MRSIMTAHEIDNEQDQQIQSTAQIMWWRAARSRPRPARSSWLNVIEVLLVLESASTIGEIFLVERVLLQGIQRRFCGRLGSSRLVALALPLTNPLACCLTCFAALLVFLDLGRQLVRRIVQVRSASVPLPGRPACSRAFFSRSACHARKTFKKVCD